MRNIKKSLALCLFGIFFLISDCYASPIVVTMDINTLLDTYPDYYDYARIDEFILQLNSPVAPNGQEIHYIVLLINNRSGGGCKLSFKCFNQDFNLIGSCVVETTYGIKKLNITGGTNCSHTIQVNSTNVVNVKAHLGKRKDSFSTIFAKATVYAGAGNDRIQGGPGNDLFYGEDGNDSIKGFGGNDELYGGSGKNTLLGMDGNDILNGGNEADTLYGGPGQDRCNGGNGGYGMSGNDVIWGDYPNAPNNESNTDDYIEGWCGNDVIYGGPGNDIIKGGLGNDIIHCGPGNDGLPFVPGIGPASVDGQGGNDIISGEEGDDRLEAGLGVDRIYGGPGNDVGICGQNTDTTINVENLFYYPVTIEP